MKAWKTLDRAKLPTGEELVLQEHDGTFVIRVDNHVLMSNRTHASEEAMAEAGLAGRKWKEGPRVLLGGLGLGFTLRAALNLLPIKAEVRVAELSEAVIAWNRGVLAPLSKQALEDGRVDVEAVDLIKLLKKSPGEQFDAVLLDIDNGPSAVTASTNGALYSRMGVELCRKVLRPRGRLVVWSAGPDASYVRRLSEVGFEVETREVKARAKGSASHVLFIATL